MPDASDITSENTLLGSASVARSNAAVYSFTILALNLDRCGPGEESARSGLCKIPGLVKGAAYLHHVRRC